VLRVKTIREAELAAYRTEIDERNEKRERERAARVVSDQLYEMMRVPGITWFEP
jgi:hypothetical protein